MAQSTNQIRDKSIPELVVIANTTSVGPFSEDNRSLELHRRFTAALLLEPNFENLVKHAQEIDL
jgi:hypothetical protein